MQKLENKVVLIVDDEDSNIYALQSYLDTLDVKIRVAKNGAQALSLLQQEETVDIILLDMMTPIMDGYETLQVLKENDSLKKIPVIAVTAKAMKGDREKCLEAGAWDYVSKPLDMKLLIEKITQLVR